MSVVIPILVGFCALLAGFFAGWFLAIRVSAARHAKDTDAARAVFQALAAEQLEKNTDRFLKMADEREKHVKEHLTHHKEAITNLLNPLSEKLKDFDKQRQEMYGRLANELKRVTESSEKLRSETSGLISALRQPQVRGRWGESTLRRVVELAGMVERVDFVEQESTTTEEGRLRPDMTISLPNGHAVVVDSKVALDAYLSANEETDEENQMALLKRHARQMRDHMLQLSRKQYWEHLSEGTEFVVMFVPGESFLSAALQHDATLMEDAMQKRVVIATPATLIALLRAIEYGWRQAALQVNAQEISRIGRDLYKRVNTFASHLDKIRKGLHAAVSAFNNAVGSFERQLLPQMRRFKELRADDGKEVAEVPEIENALRSLPPEEPGELKTEN